MKAIAIDGAFVSDVVWHGDARGTFAEIMRASDPRFAPGFGQLSYARRSAGTVTAWHIHPHQWDWWFVAHGALRAVLHDLRPASPTAGATFEVVLGPGVGDHVLTIPPGVAHGYKVLEGPADIVYLTSHEYLTEHPAPPLGEEGRLPQDDPAIGYDWSR